MEIELHNRLKPKYDESCTFYVSDVINEKSLGAQYRQLLKGLGEEIE